MYIMMLQILNSPYKRKKKRAGRIYLESSSPDMLFACLTLGRIHFVIAYEDQRP